MSASAADGPSMASGFMFTCPLLDSHGNHDRNTFTVPPRAIVLWEWRMVLARMEGK